MRNSWTAALVFAALAVSCSQGSEIHLYNNTTETLILTGRAYSDTLETIAVIPKETRTIPSWYENFVIESRLGRWCYDSFTDEPPVEFVATRGFQTVRYVRGQVESDGTIFIAPKGAQVPVAPSTDQPVGFPLQHHTCT